jgi:hypothetical protein
MQVLFFEQLGQYFSREGERGDIPGKTGMPPLSPFLGTSGKERRKKSFLIAIGTLLLLLY